MTKTSIGMPISSVGIERRTPEVEVRRSNSVGRESDSRSKGLAFETYSGHLVVGSRRALHCCDHTAT